MKTCEENTYNERTIEQIGLDWDEYEEMMAEYHREELDVDCIAYTDDCVQRAIRNWDIRDVDVNDINHWLY